MTINKVDNIVKVIECLGEMLVNKDNKITYQEYEIERLKKKIEAIEKYADFYSTKNSTTKSK